MRTLEPEHFKSNVVFPAYIFTSQILLQAKPKTIISRTLSNLIM
jgi:hypothetical protein